MPPRNIRRLLIACFALGTYDAVRSRGCSSCVTQADKCERKSMYMQLVQARVVQPPFTQAEGSALALFWLGAPAPE